MKKKTMKRNQIIIGALTVLLGVAGYINFSGNKLDLAPGALCSVDGSRRLRCRRQCALAAAHRLPAAAACGGHRQSQRH